MKNNELPKSNKIIVGNLIKKISCEDLRKLFKEFGEITKIGLIKHKDYNTSEITFRNWESAENALGKHNTIFKLCPLSVELVFETKLKQEEIDNELEMSDNEGYDVFMNEYKLFYRDTKKTLKTRVQEIGFSEVNLSEMLSQANTLYLSNQHEEAIKLLHEIIKQSPELQEPYQILSQIYEEKNDFKNALSFLMLAAQLSNGDKDIWIRCCTLNKQIKNYQQAEYCITRALKLEKKNIYILFERGSLNEKMGNIAKATRIYETLINYHPNLEILIYTAKLHEKLNRTDKAIALIERNHFRLQKKLQAILVLFDLYLKNRKYEKGVLTYNSIKMRNDYNPVVNNDNFQIKRLLCFLYMKEIGTDELSVNDNEFLSSEDIMGEIVKHFSLIINTIMSSEIYVIETEIENLYHLFNLLENLNQIKLFIEFFNRIETLLQNTTEEIKGLFYQFNPEIYTKIAEYFFTNKEFNQAVDFFEKCLNIKNDDLIRVKLSEAYALLGQNNKAIEILQSKPLELTNEIDGNGNNANNRNNDDEYTISNYMPINNKRHELSLSEMGNDSGEEKDELYNFIKNQINDDEDDDCTNKFNNETYNHNDNDSYAELMNLENQRDDLMINKILDAPNFLSTDFNKYNSKKLIGRKRLRTSSKIKSKDKLFIDYNFDNYLHRKIRSRAYNSTYNTKSQLEISNPNLKRARSYSLSSVVNTLNSLKNDFDELSLEVKSHKNLYLKLQESILLMQANNIDKFILNTFDPLKKILIQELKIEDYKTDLFNYILDKSLIKNYFYKKTSIFDQTEIENEEEGELTLIDALKPSNDRQIEEKEIEEDKNEFVDKKDNLFVRKTANKFFLAKKKIGKTISLVEKQLNDLENIEKYIQPENFFKIIEKFIEFAYEKESYKDVYVIITLLVNSRYFLQRNDYLSYNILLYAIMTSFHLKRYKTAFELFKRNISRYSFQDIPFFWMQFWNVEQKLSSRIARTYLYKFYFKKNISENCHFQQMIATCYFHNGNLELAHHLLGKIVQKNKSPYILLLMALSYLFQLLNRSMKIKKPNYLKALHFLNLYSLRRIKVNPNEVNYNLGRFFQFMGHDKEALEKYNELISAINNCSNAFHDPIDSQHNNDKAKLKQSCIYNMSMIIKKSGHEEEAHKMIIENIVI